MENSPVILGCRKELEEVSKGTEGDRTEGLSQNGEREQERKEEEEREREQAQEENGENREAQSQEEISCQPCGEMEGEQAREAVKVRTPVRVSKEERERHELTHTPFRSWCRHCVMGRGRNQEHKKVDRDEGEEESAVPRISMDYFFLSEEDEKACKNPMVVMVDEKTGEKYARVVASKGLSGSEMDWLVIDMSKELKA